MVCLHRALPSLRRQRWRPLTYISHKPSALRANIVIAGKVLWKQLKSEHGGRQGISTYSTFHAISTHTEVEAANDSIPAHVGSASYFFDIGRLGPRSVVFRRS